MTSPVREALEALRHADIDLSMLLPEIANDEMRASVRKTLGMIDKAREALSAAPGEPCAVKVKPLAWTGRNADGSIHIAYDGPVQYWAWELAGYGYWSRGALAGREVHGGLDEAKAAAQADYEQRIRSAFVTTPQPAAGCDEARKLIEERLRDLAEANALYANDQRASIPDKIARNEREISWLKDLRSTLALRREAPAPAEGVKPSELADRLEAECNARDTNPDEYDGDLTALFRECVITLRHPDTAAARERDHFRKLYRRTDTECAAAEARCTQLFTALTRAREAVNAIVLSTRSVSFKADLDAIDQALSTGDEATKSEGLCTVPPGKNEPVSTQTACDEGESNDSATTRRMSDSESTGSLASVIATTRREDRASPCPSGPSEGQIQHMVDRFLGWRLPENFNPDGGVSYERFGNIGTEHQYERRPSGTNILDSVQATEMVRYMIDGLPGPSDPTADRREIVARAKGHADRIRWLLSERSGSLDFALEMHRKSRDIMETFDTIIAALAQAEEEKL